MDKRFFEKRCKYSIRKFTIGVASVMVGATFFGVNTVHAAEETATDSEGSITELKPIEALPLEVASAIAGADNNGGQEFTKPVLGETEDTPEENQVPAGLQGANQPTANTDTETKPAATPASKVEETKVEEKPSVSSSVVEETEDINHLENALATANNHEQNTSFTAKNAVDGNVDTRWATDKDVERPSLEVTLSKLTKIKRIEIDWDRRLHGGVNDPNIKSWELYYSDEEKQGEPKEWKLAYRKNGQPILDEKVDLKTAILARRLKLEISDYVAGSMNWRNVGIQEFRAFSNTPDPNHASLLNQIEKLEMAEDGSSIILPVLPGQVQLIGSNKKGVIDLDNKVYKPLTDQLVKVTLEQKLEKQTVTKEFEVLVKGLYEDEGQGTKPRVAPAVQQWYGRQGTTSITSEMELVAGDSGFEQAVEFYQSDLLDRGLKLNVVNQSSKNRIEFKKVEDRGYGQEGYGISIQDGVIRIEAASNKGAFYATRTLLQMGEENLQNGEIRDFPSFSHRGFMLDTGRKFIPYDTLVDIMLNMAYYKMNDLQLHLNDNYIFLSEHIKGKNLSKEDAVKYVLEHAQTGFRVETDVVGENGVKLTSKDYYSKEEMQQLIELANTLGINLVPEIDTPGHALSFVKARPDLMYQGSLAAYAGKQDVERVAMLDLDNKYEETLAFVKSVYDNLLDEGGALHGVKTVHIGTDEYYGSRESYRRYVNDLIQYIKSKGYTPRIWGSLSAKRGKTPVDWKDVEVDIWSLDWQKPTEAIAAGAKIINITDIPTYSVPSGSNQQGGYGDYANYEKQYNQWTPNDFTTGRGPLLNASHPSILGGGHAVWNDNIDLHETGMTSYDIFKRFFKSMQATAEKTWGSDRAAKNVSERLLPAEEYAPQSNPEKVVGKEDLFTLNTDTFSKFTSQGVKKIEQGLEFNKTSQVTDLVGEVGPGHVLNVDVTLSEQGEQIFATSGKNKLYLADEEGYIGYQFEHVHIRFNKKLEVGKRYKVTFVTKPQATEVYVDGNKLERLAEPTHPKLTHTSLVLPLDSIGGFSGILHNVKLTDESFVNPRLIVKDQLESVSATSQELPGDEKEGAIEKAFDGDPSTFWHSKWKGDHGPYTVRMTLKEASDINGLTYLPRPDGGNGVVTSFEVYAQKDGQMTKVASGKWMADTSEKTINFEAVKTDKVELKILEGQAGFASAAEIQLLKPAPETPQVIEEAPKPTKEIGERVDTVELPDSYIADNTASAEAIATASESRDYLEKEYTVFPNPQKVRYGKGVTALDKQVNLIFGEQLDVYTRNRLKSVLQSNKVSYTTSKTAVTDATNIYLGVHGQHSQAEKELTGVSENLFDKIDAYALSIKDGTISIVGKDTDAVFYGLTTLKQMLKESTVPVLRQVTVEDFAEIKNRGFIEGYYGNPWSNADRAELMRFGGDLKLTQYFFAPKDDPYHNKKWRELYPEEKLSEIRELARVGNENKTRYVWTIHPFMHNRIRFGNEEHYKEDLETIKAKFSQLMAAGVREFGILADDAATPVGGYHSYNRLMKDMTNWLAEKQTQYGDLRKEMIFVPSQYWGNGREAELKSLNEHLPDSASLTVTGGRVWGEVSQNFLSNLKQNLTTEGQTYRPVMLWINWPCTDNSKQHLILGGGEKFLHPGVDAGLIKGIMLNPMQQSEPSKIALFNLAQYTWKQWKSEEDAKKVNDLAFNFVENGDFKDSSTSRAFRELGKHMINQNMDNRVVKLEESIDLAPKLSEFLTKLQEKGDVTTEILNLQSEFSKIKEAAKLYKDSGDKKIVSQIHYWLDNAVDQMDALEHFLHAVEAIAKKDNSQLWEHYYNGLQSYNRSQTYTFRYIDHNERAELGVQHIRPFILALREYLANEVQQVLYPDQVRMSFISNRTGVEGGVLEVTDGSLSTHAIIKSPAAIKEGDYVGLEFNKVIPVKQLAFAMGTKSNPKDTFNTARVEYLNEENKWVTLSDHPYVGNESIISFENLTIQAKAVRLIATADRENTWLAVQEIAINRPLLNEGARKEAIVSISPNLIYKYQTTVDKITDGKDTTEAMFANADGQDSTPVGAWIALDLGEVSSVSKVRLVQGGGDKLETGVLEYSVDGTSWQELEQLKGEQSKEITKNISARYIRVRNQKEIPLWWRIADFSVETKENHKEFIDTNLDNVTELTVNEGLGHYELILPTGVKLPSKSYIGLKLDRLHEVDDIRLTGSRNETLSLEYSPNAIEWYSVAQLENQKLARYIRLVNKTDSEEELTSEALLVKTKEVASTVLQETSMGVHPTYGANDVRKLHNLNQLFDGDYTNSVEFSDYAHKDGSIVLKLGTERDIKKIRAYIQDGTQNYLRDGKIQISQDGKTWTDVVTVGDGQENSRKDDSLTDGWVHDASKPGNRFIEGELSEAVKANYLRVLFTANYPHRFVSFSELVINDGEYVKAINNPTIEGSGSESSDNLKTNIIDGKVLTSYQTTEDKGELVYHLSENTAVNHVRLVSSVADQSQVHVWARVLDKEQKVSWQDLGVVTSTLQTFSVSASVTDILDVKLVWEGGRPEFYELAMFNQPSNSITPTDPVVPDKPVDTPTDPVIPDKPVDTPSDPVVPDKPVDSPTDPVVPDKPVDTPSDPVVPDKPVDTPTDPVVPDKPVDTPTDPVVPDKPVDTPTDPVVPDKPVDTPTDPVVPDKPIDTPTNPVTP
ncbi:beta-N-acetylglucosaminidase domain-containing protein, partial [Streptococcus sp. DD10]|uniref:beta-N-acetylglucosaminidase domain-containing protein n=1 Tax=Streptococcus sp. DD10 TaxID=1777878 RepID=UPI00082E52F5